MFTGLETWELVMFAAVCAWTARLSPFHLAQSWPISHDAFRRRERERSAAPARVVHPATRKCTACYPDGVRRGWLIESTELQPTRETSPRITICRFRRNSADNRHPSGWRDRPPDRQEVTERHRSAAHVGSN